MDDRFDALTHHLTVGLSRRRGVGLLAALGLSGLVTPDATEARKKVCPPCKKRKQGKCKKKRDGTACPGGTCLSGSCVAGATAAPPPSDPCLGQPDDTACPGDGRCRSGVCQPRPTCAAHHVTCVSGSQCCSKDCSGADGGTQSCSCSTSGEPCYTTIDCCQSPAPQTCVGYVCVTA
jgi:hypothetical protein